MKDNMRAILNKKYGFFQLFLWTVRESFFAYPLHFFLFIVLDVTNCLLAFGITYFTTQFFSVVQRSSSYSRQVVLSLCLLCMVTILSHVVNGTGHSVIPALKLKLDRDALLKLERKMQSVPPEWFEHTEFLDFVEKAYKGTEYCFALMVPMLRFLFQYGPYCVLMGIYLWQFDPVLALCVVLIFMPTFLSIIIKPDVIFRLEDNVAPVRRMDTYIKKCMGDPEYFKETRTLGIGSYFKEKFLENTGRLNYHIWQAQKKIKLVEMATTLIAVLGYGGVMALLVVSLLRGRISAALYASVLSSIALLYALCDDAAGHFLAPFDSVGIVSSYAALVNGSFPSKEEGHIDFNGRITVEDVSFCYPGSDKPALDHISFQIAEGETIAVVGNNGSGKTTLSKILLGIYTPGSGTVKIGDTDTGRMAPQTVGAGMSAVFQKFQKYKMSISDNIIISDYTLEDRDPGAFHQCMDRFDMELEKENFSDGYDTLLSRDFGGTELSGGQWQRIAILRGIYRNRSIMVLDEPTSAIDPLEETKLYGIFAELARGRTALIVTHRIGLTKTADRIMVMDQGKLVQMGTYRELAAADGKFRELLQAQKKWYIRNSSDTLPT